MSTLVDITGKRFGKLVVLDRDLTRVSEKAHWVCVCDCGNTSVAEGYNLRSGQTKSCGCLKYTAGRKHGMNKTRFYSIWENLIQRCSNANAPAYKNYGGKGIYVCGRWREFINFKEDMYESYMSHVNEYGESETSIDRINSFEGYYKGNCRWATRSIQNFNRIPTALSRGKVMGVNRVKTTGKWVAGITVNYKYHYLGTHERKEDAIKARKEAEVKFFGMELIYS